ncbi:MAG: universal stress protein [Nitrosarchaeum sp.]|nr:universal stress protein [Nitrosarchaeum sp.]
MFKKIVVAFITKKFQNKSFLTGLDIAQKFEGELTIIDCVYKNPSKFVFFETNHDKKKYAKTKEKILKDLEKLEKLANEKDIPIKIKVALTDSISDWIVDFVKEKKTDLLIIDHPHLSEFENDHYEFIIKSITNSVKVPILLLRS